MSGSSISGSKVRPIGRGGNRNLARGVSKASKASEAALIAAAVEEAAGVTEDWGVKVCDGPGAAACCAAGWVGC